MTRIVIEIPQGVDAEEVRRRIERILGFVISDEFDRFLELIEEYGLLKLQEESLREFLEEEPNVYTEEDIKG
ncbi:MAG: hypothetical protein ACTSXX_01575 [Candidatus Baldrarchaeia archaeon]